MSTLEWLTLAAMPVWYGAGMYVLARVRRADDARREVRS